MFSGRERQRKRRAREQQDGDLRGERTPTPPTKMPLVMTRKEVTPKP